MPPCFFTFKNSNVSRFVHILLYKKQNESAIPLGSLKAREKKIDIK